MKSIFIAQAQDFVNRYQPKYLPSFKGYLINLHKAEYQKVRQFRLGKKIYSMAEIFSFTSQEGKKILRNMQRDMKYLKTYSQENPYDIYCCIVILSM